jgi:hypothetical protein
VKKGLSHKQEAEKTHISVCVLPRRPDGTVNILLTKFPSTYFLSTNCPKRSKKDRISGSADPDLFFVITSHGGMMSFPAETTPFFPEIEYAQGSSMQEIPCLPDDAADQQAAE